MKSPIKLLCLMFLGLLVHQRNGLSQTYACKVSLYPTPEGFRKQGLPNTCLRLSFTQDTGYPAGSITNRANYKLYVLGEPTNTVALKKIRTVGHSVSPGNYREALIFPGTELEGTKDYVFDIRYPEVELLEQSVVPFEAEAPADESTNRWDIITGVAGKYVKLSVSPVMPLDSSKAPAIDFELRIPRSGSGLRHSSLNSNSLYTGNLYLDVDGTIKFDSNDTNVTDHLNFAADYEGLLTYGVPDLLRITDRVYYFVGLRLKAAEFEADQKFKVVNYTAKPQLALQIPYTDIPGAWWSSQTRISGKIASPITVYGGYSHVDVMKESTTTVDPDLQESDRWEMEITYAFPITQQLSANFRGRFFWLDHQDTTADFEKVTIEYELPWVKNTSVVLQYSNGRLPPKFESGHVWAVGLSSTY